MTADPPRHPRLAARHHPVPAGRRPHRAPRLGREVELVEVTTEGDRSAAPLAQLGGTGVFVSALREALLAATSTSPCTRSRTCPTAPADGIALAAVPAARGPARRRRRPRRAHPRRAARSAAASAPARRAGPPSSHALGLGFEVVGIRGNVDTRIGKVRDGEYDAVVLARAGLARLGRLDEATEVLDPLQMLPAPGQGALAVECRADDRPARPSWPRLDDPRTRAAVDRRARRARRPRGRLLGPGRGPGRGGRGRARRRALGAGRGALARRDAGGPDVRHRRPSRRRRRRSAASRARCSPRGQQS